MISNSNIQLSSEFSSSSTSSSSSNSDVLSSCAIESLQFNEASDYINFNSDLSSSLNSEMSQLNVTPRCSLRNKVKRNSMVFNVSHVNRFQQIPNSNKDHFSRIVHNGDVKSSDKILKGGTAIVRYLKSQESSEKNEIRKNIFELFKIYQYFNDRIVLLNVIDKKTGGDDSAKLNEKYISAYNSFMLPVTFHKQVYVNTYGEFKFFRAQNIFTMKSYLFKKSKVNNDNVHTLDKSSHLLLHEAKMLASIKHPNIVNYFNSWIEYQVVNIQLEDPYGIPIEEMLNMRNQSKYSDKKTPIADEFVINMMTDILSAIYYLFDDQICIHNSVMASNVWLKTHTIDLTWKSLSDAANTPYISFLLFNFENSISTKVPERLKLLNSDIKAVKTIALQMIFDSSQADPVLIEMWQKNMKTKIKNEELLERLEILMNYF